MLRPSLVFLAALLSPLLALAASVDKTRPPACGNELFGLKSSIWENLEIPVCWENPAANDERARGWVRAAVADTSRPLS